MVLKWHQLSNFMKKKAPPLHEGRLRAPILRIARVHLGTRAYSDCHYVTVLIILACVARILIGQSKRSLACPDTLSAGWPRSLRLPAGLACSVMDFPTFSWRPPQSGAPASWGNGGLQGPLIHKGIFRCVAAGGAGSFAAFPPHPPSYTSYISSWIHRGS